MTDPLTHVAVDIETTGLDATDEVTVVGFALEFGYRVCYQTDGRDTDSDAVEVTAQDRTESHVQVSAHDSEAGLLEAVAAFVAERLRGADVLLVGYNDDTWGGGFDLSFLRTRYVACDLAWPFGGLAYADLLPIVGKLFNTTVGDEEPADLDTADDILCAGDSGTGDPFDTSEEAVAAYENGRCIDVVLYNVADIRRPGQLSGFAQQHCSKPDCDLTSLTPTVRDAE